jgi:hypothetical protein
MRELNEKELEMVAGGDQTAQSVATSDQQAATVLTNVLANKAAVGNIAQSTSNTSVAAILNHVFNHSGNR